MASVSVLAGFWGQFFVRKLITILRRASLIVFILSGVIFASALTMGIPILFKFALITQLISQFFFYNIMPTIFPKLTYLVKL